MHQDKYVFAQLVGFFNNDKFGDYCCPMKLFKLK